METYDLHEDRYFSPDPSIRGYARRIYEEIKDLPIVSPHGHVDPQLFVDNKPFPNPTQLFLIPDHYIYRMLYSQGVPMENLGIPPIDGTEVETDPVKIWKLFAENYHLFTGTPSGNWLAFEFHKIFDIKEKPNAKNAGAIYKQIEERLKTPEFLPKTLFEKFNIEVLSTTDAASDSLIQHKEIRASGWHKRVIPCFRPDAVTDLSAKNWKGNLQALEKAVGYTIDSYKKFIQALEERRAFFKHSGATSTDHGVFSPYTRKMTADEAEKTFSRALKGALEKDDAALFTANMLMEMARMSTEDGLTMQIHPGSYRNHNEVVFNRYGLDKGCDIPMQTEYTFNLKELLNNYGNNKNFTLIVFTLDETAYARELAPLAGHYPAMKLGPAWWFHDSLEGMMRFRRMVTETAGFYNTVGFNDDTRAFLSIPARHDLARRVDANYLGELTARHIISITEAITVAKDLTYNLVKKAYKL